MVLMMLLNSIPSYLKWIVLTIISIVGPIISLFVRRDDKVDIVRTVKPIVSIGEIWSKIYPSPRKFPEFTWAAEKVRFIKGRPLM